MLSIGKVLGRETEKNLSKASLGPQPKNAGVKKRISLLHSCI